MNMETRKMAPSRSVDPVGHSVVNFGQNSIHYLAPYAHILKGIPQSLGINANPEFLFNSPQSVSIFPFPQSSVTEVNSHRPLWGRTRIIITICNCHNFADQLSVKQILGLKISPYSEIYNGSMSFFLRHLPSNFLLSFLDLFFLYKVSDILFFSIHLFLLGML